MAMAAGPGVGQERAATSPLPGAEPADVRHPRPARALVFLGTLAVLGVALLVGLGIWQVERRAWKLDLIARIDQRIHATPVPAPGPEAWSTVTRQADEYRHVQLTGHFLDDRPALVQAVTELGRGFWVLTPFVTDDGSTVLVNRGFIPESARNEPLPPVGTTQLTVTGLLRITEPKGGFLRTNDPVEDRWYSRDVAAIAAARHLGPVAPYFVDADAARLPAAGGAPIGGLTVVSLPNNHLVYALTWFGLALMLAGATAFVARDEWRLRRHNVVTS